MKGAERSGGGGDAGADGSAGDEAGEGTGEKAEAVRAAADVTLPAGLDSGDIVLFNRRCLSMSWQGALVCFAAKMSSNTQWDHVGVVVRHPDSGELLFLEADFGGVKLRSLRERVTRSKSKQIAVRRLNLVRSDEDRRELFLFANEMLGTPYETGPGNMIRSVINPLGKQERERMHALLLEKRAQLREIERELEEAALTLFQRRILESERKRVAGNVATIHERLRDEIRLAHSDIFEAHDDLSKVFCSELVAAAFQRLGLLESYPPAAGYTPKDFSSEQINPPGVHLLRGARLSTEIHLRDDDRRQKSSKGNSSTKEAQEDVSQWLWPRRDNSTGAQRHEHIVEVAGVRTGDAPNRESRQLIREVLRRTPLFSELPDEYKRSHLVKSFRAVVVNAGDIVFTQGDYGDTFFVLEQGCLERYVQRADSAPNARVMPGDSLAESAADFASDKTMRRTNQAVLVSTIGPKTSCGLTAFAYNVPRCATVRATEPTLLWKVDRPTYERLRDAGGDAKLIQSLTDQRELREHLKSHFLFRKMDRLGPRELQAFFPVRFRAGELIFAQGDRGDNFYIIKSGEVQRSIVHPESIAASRSKVGDAGKGANAAVSKASLQPIVVSTLGPGGSFGELSIMYDAPRAATCRARTDVEAWAINAESFHRLALGGGTQYLRAVFNHFASVSVDPVKGMFTRAGSAQDIKNGPLPPGMLTGDSAAPDSGVEMMMTAKDFLRFANLESMNLDAKDRARLESLLLMLVTGNRHRVAQERSERGTGFDDVLVDFWEFVRFDILLNQQNAEMQFAFRLADRNNSGFVDLEEMQSLLTEYEHLDPEASKILSDMDSSTQANAQLKTKFNSHKDDVAVKHLWEAFGEDGNEVIQYKEFCRLSERMLPPRFLEDIRLLMKHMLHDVEAPLREALEPLSLEADKDLNGKSVPGEAAVRRMLQSSGMLRMVDHFDELPHLIAIAFAAVLSRTAVAPLERAKILMQTGACAEAQAGRAAFSTFSALKWMMRKELLPGAWRTALFRGNAANMLRIAPASVLQLLLVEQFRSMAEVGSYMYSINSRVSPNSLPFLHRNPTVTETIALSGAAGVLAAVATYPLDLVHARLSVQHAKFQPYNGVLSALRQTVADGGFGSLFRGALPTVLGVFPYVGISFTTYEILRPVLPRRNDGSGKPTAGSAILCGMVSSLLAQGASFPLDTCRRAMQVNGFLPAMHLGSEMSASAGSASAGAPHRLGMFQTLGALTKEGGVSRLYKGWGPNFLKALPVSMISFYAYETCRSTIHRARKTRVQQRADA